MGLGVFIMHIRTRRAGKGRVFSDFADSHKSIFYNATWPKTAAFILKLINKKLTTSKSLMSSQSTI